MDKKNREIDEIIKFCEEFKKFCENVEKEATDLKLIASVAENSLRDKVGMKAVQKVDEFAREILSIVYLGEEPIRELEINMRQIRDDMEKADSMIR